MNDTDKPFTHALLAAMAERAKVGEHSSEQTISIRGALRHLTALYERIRTLIDYQEERFIRRLAISRILVRKVLILNERKAIGESLLIELVRAAYLENGTVPVGNAAKVDQILEKYLAAIPVIEKHYRAPELMRMERRILGIAAAEIGEVMPGSGTLWLTPEDGTVEKLREPAPDPYWAAYERAVREGWT